MFTLNSYNISELYWNPVDFNVVGDQFNLSRTPITFSNGMKFNLYPFLTNIKDITFNNKSGIILSDLYNNTDIIENKTNPLNTGELTTIKTIVSDFENKIYKSYEISPGLSGLKASLSAFSIESELTFNFIGDQVYVENYYGQILTNGGVGYGIRGSGNDQLYFLPKTNPLESKQRWDYFLNDDGVIILFADGSNYTNIVLQNQYSNLEINQFDTSFNSFIPSNSFLTLKSFYNKNISHNCVADSFTVKYDSSPISNKNSLSAIKTSNTSRYVQNYLGIFPYENINNDGTCDFYFHALKNYHNTEYNYSSNIHNRIYYKIHSGTNQENGLDKIYLSYQTNTINVPFPANEETNFYISPTSEPLSLNELPIILPVTKQFNVLFVPDGARAGNCPYVSDRITTSKKTNFDEIKAFLPYINSQYTEDTKFLCSWLYEDPTDVGYKVWMDRYYNAAYYTLDQALLATHMLYHDKQETNNSIGLVFDVISTSSLTPGVLYKYYHAGNKDSRDFLIDLNYKQKNIDLINVAPQYCNILNVTSWNSSTLKDESYYKHDGLTFGNSANFGGDYWSLDGTNYAIFQASDILLESKTLTTSIWLSVDDWSNINGYQIFGNYYNSGFGLINDANTIAPILTLLNNGTNKIYNFNCNLGEISQLKTQINGDIVQRLSDMSYWIFDSQGNVGVKYNVDNSVEVGPISAIGLTQIDQIETDKDENLYLYDNAQKKYNKFTKDGVFLTSKSVSTYSNRIEIDLNGNVYDGLLNNIGIYGNCSVVDNENSVWQVIGPNLYKNNNIVTTIGASNQISCDMYNNIWVISENDEYTKLKSNGEVVFRYKFNKVNLPVDDNCPPQPPIETLNVTAELDEDLPFLSKEDRKTYILTLDDYKNILVTPPKKDPLIKTPPSKKRIRSIDFINLPVSIKDNTQLTTICGLSAIEYDNLVMVDRKDKQVYIINQLGQPVIKLNLETLLLENEISDFITDGDFTGYQNIRKYKKKSLSNLAWKFQINDNGKKIPCSLGCDVSNLTRGWHNFTFTFNPKKGEAVYYIDSYQVPNGRLVFGTTSYIDYKYRTSLLLGTTTIKNTILNNFLNLTNGYRFVGSVGDLKMYSIALNKGDVEQLYYSSVFAPTIKTLNWNMPVGYRNYTEEITEWFQFQLPTNKSKYYNINIHNLNVDDGLKSNIELAIQNIIGKLSPAHTVLNQINWK